MQTRQLAILGVGLLGGSLGLAVRAACPGCQIVGFGHRPQTLKKAMEIGAINRAESDPAAAVAGADLIVLCTPVGTFEKLLHQIAPALSPGCLVTDVGSTKRSVVKWAEGSLPESVDFVASHPMAGSEKRGVEFARADLFQHALCILTPTPKTRPAALARMESFWQSLGMTTTKLTPESHDRLVADISHLPHLLAAALVAMQDPAALELSGKGFLDATRIAGGDGGLWRDILVDNADNLRDGVKRLRDLLDRVLGMIDRGEGENLSRWLDEAARRRAEVLQKKLREMNPD